MNTSFCKNLSENRIIRIFQFILLAIGGIALAAIFAVLFGYVVMLLWNWLMPAIFGLTIIKFWQAVGLVILARIFFGNFKHKPERPEKPHKHPFNWFKHKTSFASNGNPNWKDWHHYESYWKDEGEVAFQEYVEKKKSKEDV